MLQETIGPMAQMITLSLVGGGPLPLDPDMIEDILERANGATIRIRGLDGDTIMVMVQESPEEIRRQMADAR
jgi:hypothetical protein